MNTEGKLMAEVDDFFSLLPHYYETDSTYIVHAGFDCSQAKPLLTWKEMLWIREMQYDAKKLKGKRVVHGHVPRHFKMIKLAIEADEKEWAIDNGCVRAKVPGFGKLICLDLDSGKMTTQKNVDLLPG